jgi:hypothetical protein
MGGFALVLGHFEGGLRGFEGHGWARLGTHFHGRAEGLESGGGERLCRSE